jgi:ribosomal protein S11
MAQKKTTTSLRRREKKILSVGTVPIQSNFNNTM